MDIPYYDTTVSVTKSIRSIEDLLDDFEVLEVRKRKEEGSAEIKSIVFILKTETMGIMPVEIKPEWKELFQYVKFKKKGRPYTESEEANAIKRAKQCAWRLEYWSIKSQLARVKAKTTKLHIAFLPDILIDDKGTKMVDMLESKKMLLTSETADRRT